MPNKANVSTGKPKVAGAVFRAAAGSTLPTDPTTALDTAFTDLGYISEDGVTNNNSPETENIKAWGGQVVLVVSTEKPDEFQLTFIEALNVNVLKTVYGDANVTTAQNGVVTVKATADEPGEHAYVIDMILKGGAMRRIVIPAGVLKETAEIVYKDDEAIGYQITLSCLPDATGVTHYEYTATA